MTIDSRPTAPATSAAAPELGGNPAGPKAAAQAEKVRTKLLTAPHELSDRRGRPRSASRVEPGADAHPERSARELLDLIPPPASARC